MKNFSLKDFEGYEPQPVLDTPVFRALLDYNNFVTNPSRLAIVGIGGTISSTYSFADETIYPSAYSPFATRLKELDEAFCIAESEYSFLSLCAKDSRDLKIDDIKMVIDFIDSIDNERVIVTSGTYGIPMLVQVLAACLKKPKSVCVTGSLLPSCFIQSDCDINIGTALSAVNMSSQLSMAEDKPLVLCGFHGRIYSAKDCEGLDLHPVTAGKSLCLGPGFTIRREDDKSVL